MVVEAAQAEAVTAATIPAVAVVVADMTVVVEVAVEAMTLLVAEAAVAEEAMAEAAENPLTLVRPSSCQLGPPILTHFTCITRCSAGEALLCGEVQVEGERVCGFGLLPLLLLF